MKKFKRELSNREIVACEQAVGSICHCRCGGAYHGAARGGAVGLTDVSDGTAIVDAILKDREALRFYQELPADDPHHIRTDAEVKASRKVTSRAAVVAQRILRDMTRSHFWRLDRSAGAKSHKFVLGEEVAPEEAYSAGERRPDLYDGQTVRFHRCAACGSLERIYLRESAEVLAAVAERIAAQQEPRAEVAA